MGTKEKYEARKRDSETEKNKKKWWFNQREPIDRFTGWLVVWTALLFIATIASVVVLGITDSTLSHQAKTTEDQLRVMQGQLNEMKSSSADTKALVAAATSQAEAARVSANSITEQLAIQREMLNRAYRPRLSAEPVSVDDFVITESEFRASVTFIFRNYGTSAADDVETTVKLLPLDKAIKKQDSICEEAAIFQALHLENLKKQNLPEIYRVIPQNQPSPTRMSFGIANQSAEFRSDAPPESSRAKWTNPAMVGCIAYRGADDKKVHYTRFLYDFTERGPDGNPTFITIDPHIIAAASVVIRRWPEAGNSED